MEMRWKEALVTHRMEIIGKSAAFGIIREDLFE